jgi:hypothetical protein
MLLSNRRIALLHFLLAAMQAAWIAVFFVLAWPLPLTVWQGYLVVLAGLLAWMLALELLGRASASPTYDAVALGGLVLVIVLLARVLLYPGGAPWSLAWIGRALTETANWTGGLPPLLVLIALNILLWQRASSATSRDLHFFGVGVTFRSGLLLLIFGGALLSGFRALGAIGLLWLYLAAGLAAVSISRVSEKASEAQSTGRLLPLRRLLQIFLAVAAAVGATALFSLAYTRAAILAFFHLFDPFWQLVRPLALAALMLLGRLLDPIMVWLDSWLSELLARGRQSAEQASPSVSGSGGNNPLSNLPRWPFDLARDVVLALMIVLAVVGFVVFLLLYLERVRKSGNRSEDEDEGLERATLGGGLLRRAVDSVRGAGALVRRFGVSRDLLAAISVQNIYANICRIARQRGHPRRISQPPDIYLPVLARAFPGQDERLRRITAAYMRVHYGEHPVVGQELAALRADYRALRDGVLPEVAAPADAGAQSLADGGGPQ